MTYQLPTTHLSNKVEMFYTADQMQAAHAAGREAMRQEVDLLYKVGWIAAALWAKRDDLIADIGSNSYAETRDAALAKLKVSL